MKINFLKVFNGDSIHISYIHNGKDINIVIDSGSSKAYEEEEQTPPHDIISGEFKNLIDSLKKKKQIRLIEKLKKLTFTQYSNPLTVKDFQYHCVEFCKKSIIDLLIMTHVDDDHIGGVLKWMESEEFDINMIDKVWFNSGKLINEYFTNLDTTKNIPTLKLNIFESLKTSIADGVSFEEKIKDIGNKKLIKADDIYEEKQIGAKFLILSPSEGHLQKLLTKWKDEEPDSLKTSIPSEYKKTLKMLLEEDENKYDNTVHNGSSIAFVLEIKNKKMLFLADSFHTTIVESMKRLGISYFDVDLVKISHHGSKYNTSNKLLEKINCKKYVISTSLYGGRPHKVTIARIINNNPNCEIYFNYKEEIENKMFMSNDHIDYEFSIHDTKDLIL